MRNEKAGDLKAFAGADSPRMKTAILIRSGTGRGIAVLRLSRTTGPEALQNLPAAHFGSPPGKTACPQEYND